ncbi:MarR family winged helix-turn-helix transcriptional regulator [Bailinhaonella thermotolerans]|uniref:MarR family transcriptional regulator n=1 Tax=Bailinhaonella thermotolerans TaxID=1070861 RepID=A0A3A4A9I7_9ACTN|nr:MarR family transcriptional regulator [Bailinhaonella thermotolerans]RJL22974.1 MarR family transcriptional regulator [Bailinhaonella thermotolerans]
MEEVPDGEDGPPRQHRAAVDDVAAALATVGNWMFAPATRRKIMASSGLELSLGDYTLLAQVSLHAPVRLSVLAELMEVDKSTLSPPAKRLEARGFIERRPDPADARAQLVSVTRDGKLAIRKLWKARAAAVAALMADWETADIERLATSLGALSESIKKGR